MHTLVGDDDRALVVDDLADETYEVAPHRRRGPDSAVPHESARGRGAPRRAVHTAGAGRAAHRISRRPARHDGARPRGGGAAHKALVDAVKRPAARRRHRPRPRREGVDQRAVRRRRGQARTGCPRRDRGSPGRRPRPPSRAARRPRAAYGPGARLGADDVEPFLGEAGGVPPWELTDAIDRGDTAAALDRLPGWSAVGTRHPLQVIATLRATTAGCCGCRARTPRTNGSRRAARPEGLDVPGAQGARPGPAARVPGSRQGDRAARRGRPRPAWARRVARRAGAGGAGGPAVALGAGGDPAAR